MVCQYLKDELCSSGKPSDTIMVMDAKHGFGRRRICDTRKFLFCPKYNKHVSESNVAPESDGSSALKC